MDTSNDVALLIPQLAIERRAIAYYDNGANWANLRGYPGSADYCHRSAKEEAGHWKAFNKFLRDVLMTAEKPPIPAVPEFNDDYGSLLDFWEATVALEQKVTVALEDIYDASSPRVRAFVVPFLVEQNDSLRDLQDFVRMLANAGDDPAALLAVDHRIGKR